MTTFLLLLALITTPLTSSSNVKKVKLAPITSATRMQYIERARVWHKTDVSSKDILAGPQNEIAVAPETEVTCHYVEWTKKPSGATPKFLCKLDPLGETVRVKYGDSNREMFAEVAATRLFWALGFYSDDLYPVKIRCLGCPEKSPWKPKKGERRIERFFNYAIMERQFSGITIEESKDQGWSLKELEKIDAATGGAPREQVDALKLLLVLIQHGDQKPEQQRLACLKEDIQDPDGDGTATCVRATMMVQDLGATFGNADQFTTVGAKMNVEGWASKSVWNRFKEKENFDLTGQRVCFGDLTNSIVAKDNGLQDPVISEEGRRFLSDLLMQLSEQQIRDLFVAARGDRVPELLNEKGRERLVEVDDWAAAFLKKRSEIAERHCPQ